ncbi:MAG: polysaccharide deacetylase family protein [Ferruginibacter sp.]
MDDHPGRCSRILMIAFYVAIISTLNSCSNKLSHQDNTIENLPDTDTGFVLNERQPEIAFSYDSTKRYIYLTLDDGPQPGTMNCYRILKDQGVKTSFFMIGVQLYDKEQKDKKDSILHGYPEFLLCNHSYTHANFNHYKSFYNNPDSAFRDVIKAEEKLEVPVKIFRTPGNNSWAVNGKMRAGKLTRILCTKLDSAGYKIAGWDVEWRFKNENGCIPVQSAASFINEVKSALNNDQNFASGHLVILAHDRMFAKQQYADSLNKFIAALKADPRNVFETIDHYPAFLLNNKITCRPFLE